MLSDVPVTPPDALAVPPDTLAVLPDWFAVPLQSGGNAPLFVIVLGGVGVFAIYAGWRRYEAKRLIEDTPTSDVRSMAAGRTELTGRAWSIDEPYEQPFGGGKAVVATYEIEEYESSGKHSSWKTKESGALTAPFLLDDGTGEAIVDATDDAEFKISDRNRYQVTVGRTEGEPPGVKRFLRTHSDMDVPDSGLSGVVFGEKRRYTQEVIPPGESVYVLGGAAPRPDVDVEADQDLVVGRDDSSDRFIVSDRGPENLASSYGWLALGIIALGVLSLAGAFYLLVTLFGVVG